MEYSDTEEPQITVTLPAEEEENLVVRVYYDQHKRFAMREVSVPDRRSFSFQ